MIRFLFYLYLYLLPWNFIVSILSFEIAGRTVTIADIVLLMLFTCYLADSVLKKDFRINPQLRLWFVVVAIALLFFSFLGLYARNERIFSDMRSVSSLILLLLSLTK